jgi:hypothetical protein
MIILFSFVFPRNAQDKLAAVAPATRSALLTSLHSGITSPNARVTIATSALRALRALASYHLSTLPAVQRSRYAQRVREYQKKVESDRKLREKAATSTPAPRKVVSLKARAAARNNALTNSVLSPPPPSAAASPTSSSSSSSSAASGSSSSALQVSASPVRPSAAPRSPTAKPPGEFVLRPESPFGPDLSKFQSILLHMVLLEQVSSELLEPVADALLPLIVASPQTYNANATQFIQAQLNKLSAVAVAHATGGATPTTESKGAQIVQQNAISAASQTNANEVKQRLTAGFSALISEGGLVMDDTRVNRDIFRNNIRKFVQSVRTFVQNK